MYGIAIHVLMNRHAKFNACSLKTETDSTLEIVFIQLENKTWSEITSSLINAHCIHFTVGLTYLE